ncbi:site-specific recombinase XerD [Xenococcus sp. PCC 7305]|uniref:site-specific integrase n=1 Tax=Xenococcus sp. PCC 7305 TaxID=102125 RepID=UPI0002ABE807|nr:site-specific integrase [Xenococcus sp. PCC 7305]ELS03576.1 site-specific recombinase XerD [Xenococcus sp. PCC 7305]
MKQQQTQRSYKPLTELEKKLITCHHCGSDSFVKKRKSRGKKRHQIYICKKCGRHFTYNPEKSAKVHIVNPEAEYKKDIWDIRNLGIPNSIGQYCYKLNFVGIEQPWLMTPAKQYIKFILSTLSFSSASEKLLAIKQFSRFLTLSYPEISSDGIDRSVVISFLAHLASSKLSVSTRCARITGLKGFFEMAYQNEWLGVTRYLVRKEDFPKRPKSQPRYIPEHIIDQLIEHLEDLHAPVQRMVLVLLECGMRISELLHLKSDCLLQDKAGDWFLRYYQFKMKKEITVPISREIVRVLQEQIRYINENLDLPFSYVFTANEGGARKEGFKPTAKLMTRNSFVRYLDKLAEQHSICDSSGKPWHFLPHEFRHTVGTRMINNGVPQHIIQKYLGHESPVMTAVYAHIHDQTMKEEVAKFHGKVVNISGQIVEEVIPEAQTEDLQWFKRTVQAQALPNGSCALPIISQGCPHANACLTCTHFRTTLEYLDYHKQELKQTEKIIQKAEANGWQRQVEMNKKVKANLENIIRGLESND